MNDLEEQRDQFLADVLTTAIEGGSNYWASFRNGKRSPDYTYTEVDVLEWEDDDAKWQTITLDDIHVAFEVIRGGHSNVARRYREELTTAYDSLDAGDMDADLADIVLQVAALTEVVYG